MMRSMKMWSKIKKALTILTNLLLIGRGKGWWSKKDEIPK
jgi:hypothetical protein